MPRTKRLTDATLVRRSQQGDRRAFRALLGRYDWRLRGLAYALLLDRAEMDVAVTTGYVRAWRDVVRIKPKDDVATWLYRVTYNACIDRLRHLESSAARAPAGEGEPAGGRDREAPTGIAAGLASLPAPERVAVVLVDREGFSPSSAARILGQTPGTLQRLLQRARDHLAAYVDEDEVPGPAGEGGGTTPAGPAEEPAARSAEEPVAPAAEPAAATDAPTDHDGTPAGSPHDTGEPAPAGSAGEAADGPATATAESTADGPADRTAPAGGAPATGATEGPARDGGGGGTAAAPAADDGGDATTDAGTAAGGRAPSGSAPEADVPSPPPVPEDGARVVPLDIATDPAARTPLVRVIAPGDDEEPAGDPPAGEPVADGESQATSGDDGPSREGAEDAEVIPVPLPGDRARGRRGRRSARAAARRRGGDAPRTGTDDPPGDPS